MKFEFSDHALERLDQRGISRRRVLRVLANPEKVGTSFRDRKLMSRRFGDKILEVVTRIENDTNIVITAYYLEDKK